MVISVTKLIIGCPVYAREWILPHWFECIENQTFPLSDIGFVFELGADDKITHKVLFDWHANHPEVSIFDTRVEPRVQHGTHPEGHRAWSRSRYYDMIQFRNSLLQRVRNHAPEKYFSLDSDILLENPDTIQQLWDLTEQEEIDAAAPLMYMTPTGVNFPSVMSWLPGKEGLNALRTGPYPIGEVFQCDIIMAAKMMSKPVYEEIDYRFHKQGEDLGWSDECRREGFNLYSASQIYAPHIMSKGMYKKYLENGDDRSL
jgi:hypothetical protein